MASSLVGIHEIAEALGVSRQRADQIARTDPFPAPVAELKMGRVWRWRDVERWMVLTDRPVKVISE